MKLLCLTFFWLLPLLAFSQDGQSIKAQIKAPAHSQLLFVSSVDCAIQGGRLAEDDLAKGAPVLLLQSGISPLAYVSDGAFEQKFRVRYFEEGCSAPSRECMMAYNARVFRYLQTNYSKSWWKLVRKDVVGFKEWKKSAKL